MSQQPKRQNGQDTDVGLNALFDIAKVEKGKDPTAKAIMVKLSPTTSVYAMITRVNQRIPHLKPTDIVRLLIRVGFAAYIRSERIREEKAV